MKYRLRFLIGSALCAILLVGCEGDQGPAGPAGETGLTGPPGARGPEGPSGQGINSNCTQCHTDDTSLVAKQLQYSASTHATGGHFERASSATCAACHSHEGFIERIASGQTAPAEAPADPTPPNCRTCHQIHTTYTESDFALVTTAPVDLWLGGTADLGDGSNLCVQCHQARARDPMPVLDGPDVTFTSTQWGPHYGPQGNLVAGDTPWEFTGSQPLVKGSGPHGQAGCPACHMADAIGDMSGGHTWNMTYVRYGTVYDNVAGCEVCHGTVDDFERWGVQASVDSRMAELEALLITAGIYDPVEMEVIPGTWSATLGAAWWNYQMVVEDRSRGIHNPAYIINLLINTIEAVAMTLPAAVVDQ